MQCKAQPVQARAEAKPLVVQCSRHQFLHLKYEWHAMGDAGTVPALR